MSRSSRELRTPRGMYSSPSFPAASWRMRRRSCSMRSRRAAARFSSSRCSSSSASFSASYMARRSSRSRSTSRLCSICRIRRFCAFICSSRSSSANFSSIRFRNSSSSASCCFSRSIFSFFWYSFAAIISIRSRSRFSSAARSACTRFSSASWLASSIWRSSISSSSACLRRMSLLIFWKMRSFSSSSAAFLPAASFSRAFTLSAYRWIAMSSSSCRRFHSLSSFNSSSSRFCSCIAAIGFPSAACCRAARSLCGSAVVCAVLVATSSRVSSKRFRGRSPYCVKKPSRMGVKTTPRSGAGYTMMCAADGALASLPVAGSAPAFELYAM
mmetsp:Transcript_55157/g.130073  ORF Transcript_55157/g.130073 Transcript_55157/m.130073 type:complete len:328 (+) Transcript_55157:149-1132(+)